MTTPGFVTPEAKALQEKYKIEPRVGPGQTQAKISPVVYVGIGDTSGPRGPRGAERRAGAATKTLDEINASFYSMSPEQVEELQARLINAGILDPNKILPGVHDDETYAAWEGINERAARFKAAGQDITPSEVIGMIERSYAGTGGGIGGEAPQGPDPAAIARQRNNMVGSFDTALRVYNPSDPASVREATEEAFRKALGRKPKDDELEKFTTAFLGRQRAGEAGLFAAQDRLARADRERTKGTFDANAASEMAASGVPAGSEADVLWTRLQRMIADAPGKITPGPRSRDLATQKRLWANYQAGRGPQAARPGTSKHGDGRANDLTYENDAVRRWALANAGKYGLAFPIYDPKKPRSLDESWHIEVAGGSRQFQQQGGHAGHDHRADLPESTAEAPISESIALQQQDVSAQATEFAEQENPVEKDAYDIGQQFNSFLSILQRGLGV